MKLIAYMYTHDGMMDTTDHPIFTKKRLGNCDEPWTETALYSAPEVKSKEVENAIAAMERGHSNIARITAEECGQVADILRSLSAMRDPEDDPHAWDAVLEVSPNKLGVAVKHMVNRFLNWKLPATFRPDGGISFNADYAPNGTNLFDATQAEAMVRYMLEGLPSSDSAAMEALRFYATREHWMSLGEDGPHTLLIGQRGDMDTLDGYLVAESALLAAPIAPAVELPSNVLFGTDNMIVEADLWAVLAMRKDLRTSTEQTEAQDDVASRIRSIRRRGGAFHNDTADLIESLRAQLEAARGKAKGWEEDARGMKVRWDLACNDIGERDKIIASLRADLAQKMQEHQDALSEMRGRMEGAERKLNTPELHNFAEAVVLEAAHQRERWGTEHDVGKQPTDWFWLVGYLAGKALASHIAGNTDKALHHCISTSAALANWRAALNGSSNTMQPGHAPSAALSPPSAGAV